MEFHITHIHTDKDIHTNKELTKLICSVRFLIRPFPAEMNMSENIVDTYKRTANPMYNLLIITELKHSMIVIAHKLSHHHTMPLLHGENC